MNRCPIVSYSVACLVLLGAGAAAKDTVPDSATNAISTPADALPWLYDATGQELERILSGPERWSVLPRDVVGVLARPDLTPTFEFGNRHVDRNEVAQLRELMHRSAQRKWPSGIRLLFNTTTFAVDGDELWLSGRYSPFTIEHVRGEKSIAYSPPSKMSSDRVFHPYQLSKGPDDTWCMAMTDGLFKVQGSAWERIHIPGWPGGAARAIVPDGRGQFLALSELRGKFGPTLAIYRDGDWTSMEILPMSSVTSAGIRPDGAAALATAYSLVLAKQPKDLSAEALSKAYVRKTSFPLTADHSIEVTCLTVPTGDGKEVDTVFNFSNEFLSGVPGVTPRGDILFATKPLDDGSRGLVRMPAEGAPEWFDLRSAPLDLQIIPARDDGFYLYSARYGIHALAKGSKTPTTLATSAEVVWNERWLGTDLSGRIYLKRAEALVTLAPDAKATPATETVELGAVLKHNDYRDPLPAAVDSAGAVWFLANDGATMRQGIDAENPMRRNGQLGRAKSLWPGRAGAMLLMLETGGAALDLANARPEAANSLLELAQQNFAAMLAAAPTSSQLERRRFARPDSTFEEHSAPWLTTGSTLWIVEGNSLHRLRRVDEGAAARVETQAFGGGPFRILGPLASGHLMLAKVVNPRPSQPLSHWSIVHDPEGASEVYSLTVPAWSLPKGVSTEFAIYRSESHLDPTGHLWLPQYNNKAYRIGSNMDWQLVDGLGVPHVDSPDGLVWILQQGRTNYGYEVVGPGFRRAFLPTFVQNLTPLFVEPQQAVCLTPQGFAWLHFERDKPELDAVTDTQRVNWQYPVDAYVGRSGRKMIFLVRRKDDFNLVSVELKR